MCSLLESIIMLETSAGIHYDQLKLKTYPLGQKMCDFTILFCVKRKKVTWWVTWTPLVSEDFVLNNSHAWSRNCNAKKTAVLSLVASLCQSQWHSITTCTIKWHENRISDVVKCTRLESLGFKLPIASHRMNAPLKVLQVPLHCLMEKWPFQSGSIMSDLKIMEMLSRRTEVWVCVDTYAYVHVCVYMCLHVFDREKRHKYKSLWR